MQSCYESDGQLGHHDSNPFVSKIARSEPFVYTLENTRLQRSQTDQPTSEVMFGTFAITIVLRYARCLLNALEVRDNP